MADVVKEVVNEGEDVFLTAMEILLGGFIGEALVGYLPLPKDVPKDLAVLGLGIGIALTIDNSTIRNLGYGMAVSGAMNFLSPYVASMVSKVITH